MLSVTSLCEGIHDIMFSQGMENTNMPLFLRMKRVLHFCGLEEGHETFLPQFNHGYKVWLEAQPQKNYPEKLVLSRFGQNAKIFTPQ